MHATDKYTLCFDFNRPRQVNEQLKKESGLRKKYKNELEDLKGNIRVYARCRPFAQYEKERLVDQYILKYYFK